MCPIFGRNEVGTMDDLYRVVATKPPQTPVLVTVLREGKARQTLRRTNTRF